ncbi:MAG: anhydro-N-acetylmuramic acid kinase [Phycisphaerae bacterium]
MATQRVAIGMMSGTSADGIDAVAVRVAGSGPRMRAALVAHRHTPYAPALRRRLLAAMAPAATTAAEVAQLDVLVGRAYGRVAAALLRQARLGPRDVTLIAAHGQTLCHLPAQGATLQIGRSAEIAAATGVGVVSDFRSADLAAGGEGAPLVPWTDWVLLRSPRRARAIQNVGGVANVTWLPAGGDVSDVRAFDTGPGNMVMDELVRTLTRGRRLYDARGALAARGRVAPQVLQDWLAHPFFSRRPPKSCGREQFGREFTECWLRHYAGLRLSIADWLATALALTVESIASAYERFLPRRGPRGAPAIDELILCGGGAKNLALRAALARRLPSLRVAPIEEYGIPAFAKEALSFALLGLACADREPANLPRVTRARRRVVLGTLTPASEPP